MIENIDRQVGRFLEVVERRGELENTLVLYASDHGEMLGDHGRWGKSTWHEPSVHVPLVAAGHGVRPGATSAALVEIEDLAATFLGTAGAAALPEADARSLGPVLAGDETAHREVMVSGLNDFRTITDGRHKLVARRKAPDLLFELANDPWEDRDRASQEKATATRLREALRAEIGEGWWT